jgi:hypothetical protein
MRAASDGERVAGAANVSLPERSAMLTDPERMRAVFQHQLAPFAAGDLRLDACRIVHTRYRTSVEQRRDGKAFLSICYEVEVHDARRGREGRQWLHAKGYPDGRGRRRFEQARARPHLVAPRFGDPVAYLPGLDAVVWAFPNDPKLPHLPEVIDPERVRRQLPWDRLPAGLGAAPDLGAVGVHVIRYKPEVRCTTRYELGGTGQRLALYGKTFRHQRGGEIARRIEHLRTRLADDPLGFLVARPLGYTAAVRTVWQEALAGPPMVDLVGGGGGYPAFLEAAAGGLARLHALDLPGLMRATIGDRLQDVRGEAAELGAAFPALAPRLASLTARLAADLARLRPFPDGLVHGDFLAKQLIVCDGRLGLVDFDNLFRGDPMQDLATFLVDLHLQGLDAGQVDALTTAFLRAYGAQGRREVPLDRLRWHGRAQLLSAGFYLHKRQHLIPGFAERLAGLLALAEGD